MQDVQRDFGGFNPRFLGITVNVETERFLRLLEAYFEGKDLRAAFRDAGAAAEGCLEVIGAATVVQHETRHFHDFLLAPAGGATLRTRLLGYAELPELMAAADQGVWADVTCLPVPLSAWCAMAQPVRDEYLGGYNAWRGDACAALVAPKLPVIQSGERPNATGSLVAAVSDETIGNVVRTGVWRYEHLGKLLGSPTSDVGSGHYLPMHLSELSAILVQAQAARQALGPDAAERLLEHLAASPGSRYSPALRSLRLVAGGRCTADQLAAAAIWALLGAWPHDGYEEHPAVRFDRVVQLLHDQGWPDGDAPVRRLYGEWDRQLERKSVFQTLRESIARDREFLTTLARLRKESKAGQPRGSGEGFKDAARIYTRYSHARADCVKLFNASPDTYVQASLYLKDTIHKLISPPLMIDFKGSIRPTVDACTAMGWKVWLGNEATEEHPASARIVIPKTRLPGKRQRRPKIAFEASAKLAAADVLFSPLRLTFDDADRALAQQALPHIRLISAPRYHRAS